jgi:hypothetical protein
MSLFSPPPRIQKPPHPYSMLPKPPGFRNLYLANIVFWIGVFHLLWIGWLLLKLLFWRKAIMPNGAFVLFEVILLFLSVLVAHLMSYRILFLLRDASDRDKPRLSR